MLYPAGADPCAEDQLAGLSLTIQGLLARDALVISECALRGVPVAATRAGGYSRDTAATVVIHYHTVQATRRIFG